MRCYQCSLEGADHEAVAVCSICGMGLCMEHAKREEMDVWEGEKKVSRIHRFICQECQEAYNKG
jgi:hypothetical protein